LLLSLFLPLFRTHQGTRRLNHLVDHIHDWFKDNVIVGEVVNVDVDNESETAKVLEIIPPHSRPSPNASAPPASSSDDTSSSQFQHKPSPNTWPDQTLYRVHLCYYGGQLLERDPTNPEPLEYLVSHTAMKRNRHVLSKQNIKVFIKENATKDVWLGAPWMIKVSLIDVVICEFSE
jgi:hypothetical protein